MAIDTQEKRMAAASTARPWMRATFPTGTIDAAERASAGNTYNGNAFAAGVGTLKHYYRLITRIRRSAS